jgi:hypothetical protein
MTPSPVRYFATFWEVELDIANVLCVRYVFVYKPEYFGIYDPFSDRYKKTKREKLREDKSSY